MKLFDKHFPHYAQIKYIEYAILAEITCFRAFQFGIGNSKQPLLHKHKIGDVETAVSVYIACNECVVCRPFSRGSFMC